MAAWTEGSTCILVYPVLRMGERYCFIKAQMLILELLWATPAPFNPFCQDTVFSNTSSWYLTFLYHKRLSQNKLYIQIPHDIPRLISSNIFFSTSCSSVFASTVFSPVFAPESSLLDSSNLFPSSKLQLLSMKLYLRASHCYSHHLYSSVHYSLFQPQIPRAGEERWD